VPGLSATGFRRFGSESQAGQGTDRQAVKVFSMLVLNCKKMRRLVHAAAAIFLLGIALQLVLNLFEPGDPALPGFFPYLVFFLLLMGPLLLLVTLVIALLPGDTKKMTS
jgi:hypothetical protein